MRKAIVILLLALLVMLTPLMAAASNFFVFPDSDRRLLTKEEIWEWQYDALGYAFNEIFARNGRPFERGGKYDLYFRSQTWYKVDPNYPAVGEIANSIEWQNEHLIKVVRDEMRALGTKNPDGKAIPIPFDDKIYNLLSGFQEQYFKQDQKLKVFDGPGQHYRCGANGKAAVSTNGRVYAAGWESGWLMVMYQVNSGGVRVGFVSPTEFKDKLDHLPQLQFAQTPARTTRQSQLTEDPVMALTPIASLPAGTPLMWLSRFYSANAAWDYVELTYQGQLMRGFLQEGIVDTGY
ncbi:MAG: YARHG domain-containing protein [Clostridiales bacterium]|nr:YARHG domain-containing protein [Clostridiales bacterium]